MDKKVRRLITAFAAIFVAGMVVLTVVLYTANKKISAVSTVLLSESDVGFNDKSIRLIAQGGLSGIAPENTAVAVEQAGREGFTAVEIDIRETLDGVWVLMQDCTLGRMTDGRGKIAKQTYFDLLNFTVNNGANIELYPDTKIAELEDVLRLYAMYNMFVFLRVEQSSQEGLVKLAGIISAGSDTQVFSVLSSDRELLQRFQEVSPKTDLWFAAGKLSRGEISWLETNNGFGVVFDAGKKANTTEKIEQVLKAGIKTAAWNVNSIQLIEELYAYGVRNFYTECILPR